MEEFRLMAHCLIELMEGIGYRLVSLDAPTAGQVVRNGFTAPESRGKDQSRKPERVCV
jgi:hypothetical protein